ncbi:protein yellow [Phlebotomus argentipes]|uniref:protein yellow n=1 Tax=Phlebotomus argentipes TaxID=94469 RepID=UPI002892E3CD|nr:protein yellow [Phlebotomus argentipes]
MLLPLLVICAQILSDTLANDNLQVAYQWSQIDFNFSSASHRDSAIKSGQYIPSSVVPVGIEVQTDRLFITLPRWKAGVPASLAYIKMNETFTRSPLLSPFPNWQAHRFSEHEPPEIVSPFRIRADRCGRLWVLDTGIDDLLGENKRIVNTQLLVYDLHDDNLLRRYVFPDDQVKQKSFFANIAIEDGQCDDTFAYSADLGSPGLVVYSWKQNESWRVHHNFFHPDPLAGNYSITGINFQWDDGLFGLAVSKADPEDGFATLYFHPLSSTREFSVNTRFLRDKQLAANDSAIYREFKILGSRGPNGQSGSQFLDQLTGVLFYSLPNLNAVACWRTTNKVYTIKSQGRVYMNVEDMQFPNDIKVDNQDRLWVLSDRLHQFLYSELNPNDINFRILTAEVKDAIDHTACDTKPKTLPDIITKLGDILRPQKPQVSATSSQRPTTILIHTFLCIAIYFTAATFM